jgi:hypothetical protein
MVAALETLLHPRRPDGEEAHRGKDVITPT